MQLRTMLVVHRNVGAGEEVDDARDEAVDLDPTVVVEVVGKFWLQKLDEEGCSKRDEDLLSLRTVAEVEFCV